MAYSPCPKELGPNFRSELASSVSSNSFGDAEGADPTVGQRIDYRFGGDVPQWYRGGPTRKAVDHSEEIVVATGFGHHRYVDVDVRKTSIGDDELMNRRNRISADLGSLAVEASTGPSRDVGS